VIRRRAQLLVSVMVPLMVCPIIVDEAWGDWVIVVPRG